MHDFVLPIGPYHPMLAEPEYFKLYVRGEDIVDVGVYLGYNHKGIEKLLEDKNWYQAIFVSERICGICGVVHTSSYCLAVENLLDLDVPPRANYIRAIMNEFERIQSHMLWAGLSAHQIGFETLFMQYWGAREKVMDIVEIISGNRVHYGINTIGGVRRDIDDKIVSKIKNDLPKLRNDCIELQEIYLKDKLIRERFKGVGILTKSKATDLGAVGPVARASGVDIDVRNSGYFSYPELGFKSVIRKDGDCLARLEVRLEELLESISLIGRAVDQLPSGDIGIKKKFMKVEFGESLGRVEAPRGEVIHFVVSKGGTKPYRDRVRTPSYANNQCIKDMLVGHTIADAAVIIESLDPCFSCTDRALVVDEKTGKSKVTNLEELVPGHSHAKFPGGIHGHH